MMTVSVNKYMLDFANEARDAFNADGRMVTYRANGFIALRTGLFEDCITVHEIRDEGVRFDQWCNRTDSLK